MSVRILTVCVKSFIVHQVPHAQIALQVHTLVLVMMLVLRALQVHTAVPLQLQQQSVVLSVPLVSPLLARVHKEVTPQCALNALKGHTLLMVMYLRQGAWLVESGTVHLVLEPSVALLPFVQSVHLDTRELQVMALVDVMFALFQHHFPLLEIACPVYLMTVTTMLLVVFLLSLQPLRQFL